MGQIKLLHKVALSISLVLGTHACALLVSRSSTFGSAFHALTPHGQRAPSYPSRTRGFFNVPSGPTRSIDRGHAHVYCIAPCCITSHCVMLQCQCGVVCRIPFVAGGPRRWSRAWRRRRRCCTRCRCRSLGGFGVQRPFRSFRGYI